MARRALVLGGGGVVGVAWEAGLAWGLLDAGHGFEAWDIVVGTSAGAIVGSQLAHGRLPARADAPEAREQARGAQREPSQLDLEAVGKVFSFWAQLERTTAADAAVIGAIARTLYREHEASWIGRMRAVIGGDAWPERRLLVTAIETESGERKVFDKQSGVPLAHAVAASAAVPAITAAVEIDGKRYMDGQVHSSTHADLLLELPESERPDSVLIAMPTNAATGQGIGPHAERAAEREIALLRAAGMHVVHVTPSAEDAVAFGRNLMSPKGAPPAFAAGLAAGQALAMEMRGRT